MFNSSLDTYDILLIIIGILFIIYTIYMNKTILNKLKNINKTLKEHQKKSDNFNEHK